MAALLTNVRNTVIAGFVLALVVFAIFMIVGGFGLTDILSGDLFWAFILRWVHVLFGILWIGLLYYFNLVQMPMMPKIPDEQKPAVSKFIAPEALWYFRWAAMGTMATGLILALVNNYLIAALTLGASEQFVSAPTTVIGIGMWLGLIMWFNVWFVIWPNQQKALNIDGKFPDLTKDQKAAAARMAMLFSRTNFMLSVPMLFCMTGGGMNANLG
jgi:uncharacterized membrane protein